MDIETGVVILFNLRKHGFVVRSSHTGNVQIAPSGRLPEYLKDAIRQNKEAVLAALEGEIAPGVGSAERNARMFVVFVAKRKTPWAIATEIEGEWVYFCAFKRTRRGWTSRWTIKIPTDKFDPFRLAEALAREDLRVPVVKKRWGAVFTGGSLPKIPKISEDPLPHKDGYLR